MIKDKQFFLLSIVLIIIIFIVVFFSWRTRFVSKESSISQTGAVVKKNDIIDKTLVDEKYKSDIKPIFSTYYQKELNDSLNINDIKKFKNDLSALKVSEQFKDLHLQLTFAVLKMEKFLTSGNIKDKEDSRKITVEIMSNNPWLN